MLIFNNLSLLTITCCLHCPLLVRYYCLLSPSDYFLAVVTTPTQPQLRSKVGFDTKMTHHPPHKLNVSNISAVTDPI